MCRGSTRASWPRSPDRYSTGRLALVATRSFAEVTAPEVIVVPGGMRMDPTDADPAVQWIRAVHPTTTWTTSVCTGSLFLAAETRALILGHAPATAGGVMT